ncbi:MAG: DUF1320 domain-containing protein [Bacteroidales bacterium]|jgi:phage gp36-like protein|nr:DUF1320 domain-containing protein [Bacteroidales bacterium]
MFITNDDYDLQAREEILQLLDGTADKSILRIAERMATDQIGQYISGRYDTEFIFSRQGEDRNYFIVMITIDIALYHAWSKRAPRKMPELRAQRYQDALDWLKSVGDGTISTGLPQAPEDEYQGDILIQSKYKPNVNKY